MSIGSRRLGSGARKRPLIPQCAPWPHPGRDCRKDGGVDAKRLHHYEHAIPIETDSQVVVYPIVCAENVLCTPWFISADVFEVPEDMQEGLTSESAIEWLNGQAERNVWLSTAERELLLQFAEKKQGVAA